ncbi:MAG: hypothetical protein ACXVB9_08030 [Bdellovibrionota bacterium]
MNLRIFTFALLVSGLPLVAHAGSGVLLGKGDFKSALKIDHNGELLVSVKLSKSGKSKIRKLNETSVGSEVQAEIGGVTTHFKLREPIRGNGLEMGPYSAADAAAVVSAINHQ